jgi:hypothetical protein
MILVDTRAYSKHDQVIRCDIKSESVDQCRNVENEPISERYIPRLRFTIPPFFLKAKTIFLRRNA